jgi:hypothetical protein
LNSQVIVAFVFGVVFVVALIVLSISFPNPTAFQYNVFRIVLSLAAAGFAAMIPGFINIEISATAKMLVRAGGAMAVFVIVFFFNPAQLAVNHDETTPELNSDTDSTSLLEYVSKHHELEKIRSFLISKEDVLKYAIEKRWVGDITILPNFQINGHNYDFLVVRVEGPHSNAGDGVTFVKLMSPLLNPVTEPINEMEYILVDFDIEEFRSALRKREDFRGHLPEFIVDRKVLIVAGTRQGLTKEQIEKLKVMRRVVTYDTISEDIVSVQETHPKYN